MSGPLDLTAVFSALSADDRESLAAVPDEEQRSVLLHDLLADHGLLDVDNLAVAENVLIYPELRDEVFSRLPVLPVRSTKYVSPAYGTPELTALVADRLGRSLGVEIEIKNVFGAAGVSGALSCIALGLQLAGKSSNPPVPRGSSVLLPAPFWQGFYWCFQQQAGLVCHPVALKDEVTFQLTLEDLERAYDEAEQPRLLVLTNPHNPLGYNYDRQLLESVYEWALAKHMHVISDEMYCHSQLLASTTPFISALTLDAVRARPDRVHVVWGFAKDFGLSGFRAGFIISQSEWVHRVMTGDAERRRTSQAWFSTYGSLKHFVTREVLVAEEYGFWDRVMRLYRHRLTEAFDAVARVLDAYEVPYVHRPRANSAQFFWLDLREYLVDQATTTPVSALFGDHRSSDAEKVLAKDIAEHARVQLLTGTTLSCPEPGYFRLCFTAIETDRVVEAVERMCRYLRERRGQPSP